MLVKCYNILSYILGKFSRGLGIGDWGLGIGDWANPQSPIPKPQTPIPLFNLNDKIYINYYFSI